MGQFWTRRNDQEDKDTKTFSPWSELVMKEDRDNVKKITKILFICHGNICRSPMAEFIMKDLVHKAGRVSEFEIASAATSTEEIGNSVYPPAKRKLAEHGIGCEGKTARQMTKADYEYYDLLIGMDDENWENMMRKFDNDPQGKCHLLMEYTFDKLSTGSSSSRSVSDPWYTGDFEATWNDCLAGCKALLGTV